MGVCLVHYEDRCILEVNRSIKLVSFVFVFVAAFLCLQCFDAVGWVAGRASGL